MSYPLSTDNEDYYFVKVLIPAICGGAVFGKGGEALNKAQHDSGAKVAISKQNDFYPGTNERVCLVEGDINAIGKMLEYIAKCINDNSDSKIGVTHPDRYKQTKLVIPNSSAGFLIGKEGSNINEIKKLSGAYVQVSSKSTNGETMERCVVISGTMDHRRDATKLILNKIVQDPKLCYFPNVSYEDMPEQNSFDYQYTPNLSSPIYNYDSPLLTYPPENRNDNYFASSPTSYFSNSRSYTSTFQQLDSMASDSIHGIIRTMEVDDIFVGSIIGPKGRSIIELQEITDTNIKVSKKPTDKRDTNGKRTVTINGMYDNVCRAFLLISDKIQLERSKRDLSSVDGNFDDN